MKYQLLFVLILFCYMFMFTPITIGYTEELGVERGDEVNINYSMSVDGEVIQEVDDFVFIVDPDYVIEGFYLGMLGMKIGETKLIEVPPEQGYTDPNHALYGKTLYFDVFLISIIANIHIETFTSDITNSNTTTSETLEESKITSNNTSDEITSNNTITLTMSIQSFYIVTGFFLISFKKMHNKKLHDK